MSNQEKELVLFELAFVVMGVLAVLLLLAVALAPTHP